MEPVDYLRSIWRYKWAILLIIMLTVGFTVAITNTMPKKYLATATLETLQTPSIGLVSSGGSNQIDMSASYEQLVENPYFAKQALSAALKDNKKISQAEADDMLVRIDNASANLVSLTVQTNSAYSAKVLADAASQVLIAEASKIRSNADQQIKKRLMKEMGPIDDKLAQLRRELDYLSSQPKPIASISKFKRNSQEKRLQDEIDAELATRRAYVDAITRLSLLNVIGQGSLELVYPASVPTRPASPSMIRNVLISLAVSMLLGIGLSLLLGMVQNFKETEHGAKKE